MTPIAKGWSGNYDKESQTLTIGFPNGKTYQFDAVPPDVAEGFLRADSPGSYYNANLRGQYG